MVELTFFCADDDTSKACIVDPEYFLFDKKIIKDMPMKKLMQNVIINIMYGLSCNGYLDNQLTIAEMESFIFDKSRRFNKKEVDICIEFKELYRTIDTKMMMQDSTGTIEYFMVGKTPDDDLVCNIVDFYKFDKDSDPLLFKDKINEMVNIWISEFDVNPIFCGSLAMLDYVVQNIIFNSDYVAEDAVFH